MKRTKVLLLVAALMVTGSMLWIGIIRHRHRARRSNSLQSQSVLVQNSASTKAAWDTPGWEEPPVALELLFILGVAAAVGSAFSVCLDVYRWRAQRREASGSGI